MNGAQALIATLIESDVHVCFANPGTSEMQLVAAIDQQDGMRAILCLFEGVATGAADGYGRMADKPAATLLHLGPGLANGLANLHNARRARSPIVNLVGDHATYHLNYDAPLTSDVAGVARPMSDFVAASQSPDDLAELGASAVATALEGKIATVIVPANHAWEDARRPAPPRKPATPLATPTAAVAAAASAVKKSGAALFLGGKALREDALDQAGRIAAATGARLICETFAARMERGAGRVAPARLPYFGEMAAETLKDVRELIMIGAKPPVAFFAYPGKPGWLSPKDANIVTLADPREDALGALTGLADALGAPHAHGLAQSPFAPPIGEGKLDAAGIGAVVATHLPANAIVSDEAATAGLALYPMTQGAAKHDWLSVTGGAIGQGLPLGLGAAVACPDRKVICLQADGGGMYTLQALWTMARERLDVLTVIINNGSYAILSIELMRVGAGHAGPKARALLDLTTPAIDWVALSQGMGVPGRRATTVGEFHDAFHEGLDRGGPFLIDAVI